MDKIDIFNNSEIILRRKSFKIRYYIFIIWILLLALLLFVSFYKYHPYFNLKAIVLKKQNSYYLKTFVSDNNISDINNTNLLIDNKKYRYEIKYISDEYILDEAYNKYYEVLIDTKIDSKYYIENNIIDINVELEKTTLLKQFIQKFRKGMK